MRVKGSPFGTEFDPVNTEPVDRPQARPALAMPFRGRHKDILPVAVHVRMQGLPFRRSRTQAAGSRWNVQDANTIPVKMITDLTWCRFHFLRNNSIRNHLSVNLFVYRNGFRL